MKFNMLHKIKLYNKDLLRQSEKKAIVINICLYNKHLFKRNQK